MDRAYLSIAAEGVKHQSDSALFGELAKKLPFALEPTQTAAWEYQIQHLRELAEDLPQAHFFMEFLIPRMGRRADLIVLHGGIVFVVEYKLGARQFDRSSLDQVYGYGLDLKHFHETSHERPVVPINTGEAGIEEWLRALERSFPHWQAHVPVTLTHACQIQDEVTAPALHLATSIRSFRAERLSDFVGHVIAGETEAARRVSEELPSYPLYITRDLEVARIWLRSKRRGQERMGLLASSNAARLKPHGVFVKAKIEPAKWFLAPSGDVRSSDALEDAATEFDVQGLELDWGCLCWDANFRRGAGGWETLQFKGTRWQAVNDDARKSYIANSYRVLLTRARQGLVVFVPAGSAEDGTRPPDQYDAVFRYLVQCGFRELSA